MTPDPAILVRHEDSVPQERSIGGWRHCLIGEQEAEHGVSAWVHAVNLGDMREHYHRRATEIYYVLEGEGMLRLDGVDVPVHKGSVVQIPPGVVHGGKGRMRVLVIGIPDIRDDDCFFP